MRRGINVKARMAVLFLLSCIFLALAGVGVFAELENGKYQAAHLAQLQQPAPTEISADSQYGGSFYPLYPPELEPGDGKAETEAYCGMCHSTRYITMQPPLPAGSWEAEVTKMKKTFGATIPDEATTQIIRYLQAHYTPAARKK